jgi:hypothetical protein
VADPTALEGLSQLGGYGLALGALLVLWRLHLAAIARERATTDYERKRAEAAEAAKDKLQAENRSVMVDQVIPVLTRATDGLLRVTDSDRERTVRR